MLKPKKREVGDFDASSMADITFLLLIFFLVTTTISSDKGVPFLIPSKPENDSEVKVKGVVNVILNDQDLVILGRKGKEKPTEISQIKARLQMLGKEINAAGDSMIVSVQVRPGSTYKNYMEIIDQARSAKPKAISLAQ